LYDEWVLDQRYFSTHVWDSNDQTQMIMIQRYSESALSLLFVKSLIHKNTGWFKKNIRCINCNEPLGSSFKIYALEVFAITSMVMIQFSHGGKIKPSP